MKHVFIALTVLVSFSMTARSQSSEVFKTGEGAIHGYDPVAYFKAGKPVKGVESFKYNWNGADWYFSSQTNLDSFKVSPNRFAPVFGGYCAYGMSAGHKAPTDPEAWTIIDDKLYLNYNKTVLVSWRKDPAGYIIKANKNWPVLKDKQ